MTKYDEENVFGNSPAAKTLARELNTQTAHTSTRKKVVRYVSSFCRGLNALNDIQDFHTRMALANVWLVHHFANAKVGKHTSKYNLESTLKNVIKYRYRMWHREQPILDYIHARQTGKKFTP